MQVLHVKRDSKTKPRKMRGFVLCREKLCVARRGLIYQSQLNAPPL